MEEQDSPKDDLSQSDRIIEVKESEYAKLAEEAASFKDKYLRLFAEFDNMRKRNERERSDLIKYANEETVVEFLGILDDLERSLMVVRNNLSENLTLSQGMEMIIGNIQKILKKHGVTQIESVGQKFDPNRHEVLMQVESKDHPDGTIIEEFQKGYSLGNRVIRTAKVKVAKNVSTQAEAPTT